MSYQYLPFAKLVILLLKVLKTVIKDCIWHRFRKRNAIGFISIGLMNFLFQVAMLTKYLEQRSFCSLFSVLILIHTCKR